MDDDTTPQERAADEFMQALTAIENDPVVASALSALASNPTRQVPPAAVEDLANSAESINARLTRIIEDAMTGQISVGDAQRQLMEIHQETVKGWNRARAALADRAGSPPANEPPNYE